MSIITALATLFLATQPPASSQLGPPVGALGSSAEEILVIGRRTGIPMWRVDGQNGTVFLVGAMDRVVRGTEWDPAALTESLQRSDRIMFPNMRQAELGLFTFFRLRRQFKRHATLPAGRSLSDMLPPNEFRRLETLRQAGLIQAGYERRHPFHLAAELRRTAERQVRFETGIYHHVRRTIREHRLNLVPFNQVDIRAFARVFFAAPPERFVQCLLDSMELAERGANVYSERSRDWARRAVVEVVASPAQRVERSCRFSSDPMNDPADSRVRATIEQQLRTSGVTLAIVNLSDLAGQGGILTQLEDAGFDVRGPSWRPRVN